MKDTTENSIKRLSELNFIVIMIGITFIIIGLSSLFGITAINSMFVLAISLSGTFFVSADIVQYLSDTNSSKRTVVRSLQALKSISLACSILSLLTLPFLNIQLENAEILATAFSIIAVGLTIINLSLNHKKIQNATLGMIISGWDKSGEQTEQAMKQTEQAMKQTEDAMKNAEDAQALVERLLNEIEQEKIK
ncbi:hypothetical protein ACIQ2D_08540 [Lysinibacillus sp. NPDC097287]|uniref:hypothetical protein n=1 Tax=Lysinibacillus sp. NPDC097287 TaxID=3364144 RepID=UPI00382F9A80